MNPAEELAEYVVVIIDSYEDSIPFGEFQIALKLSLKRKCLEFYHSNSRNE